MFQKSAIKLKQFMIIIIIGVTSNSSRFRNFSIIDLCGAGLPFSKFGKNKQRFDCPLKSLEFSIDFGKSND